MTKNDIKIIITIFVAIIFMIMLFGVLNNFVEKEIIIRGVNTYPVSNISPAENIDRLEKF